MNCNCGRNCPDDKCLSALTFVVDGADLVPRLNGVPLDPISLQSIVDMSETNTRLQLDVDNERLLYTSENTEKDISSPDSILISSIASLINLNDLGDVDFPVANSGDIISWDEDTDSWVSYTIPSGTIVTPVGVDADGKLVKSGTGGAPPAPDTVPLGGILIWPAPVNTIPVSYRQCNGQALSRGVYSDLFALIGTTYGSGDGSTSFNIPNMQTRTVVGLSSTGTIDTQFQTIGQTGGAKTVSLTASQNGPHSHGNGSLSTSNAGNHRHSITSNVDNLGPYIGQRAFGPAQGNLRIATRSTSSTGSHSHNVVGSTSSSGSGNPHNNLQPYITMPYVMRVV